jgi:hypothetical protein
MGPLSTAGTQSNSLGPSAKLYLADVDLATELAETLFVVGS